jgi:hypothetical protein
MKYAIILILSLAATLSGYTQNLRKMNECVIVNGQLKQLEIDYNPATGERSVLVNGARKEFYSVYPKNGPDYAAGQTWFINNETLVLANFSYVKYGLPRILGTTDIEKKGTYKAVGVYLEAGLGKKLEDRPDVIYIPVRQGCEFQPYQLKCGDITMEKVSATATTIKVKATVTGFKGKISYEWSSEEGKIIKGQGTNTVTVDFSGKKKGVNLGVKLTAKDASNCPLYEVEYFNVQN